MTKYRYTGPALVVATPAGGAETLLRWAAGSSFDASGRVWLADTPAVDAALLLDEAAIREPHNWDGPTFSGRADLLEISVEADAPEQCGPQLAEDLFDEFPGQKERGEACFPLGAAPESRSVRGGCHRRVLVRQIDKSLAGAAGDGVECLTVRIDPAERDRPENWKPV